MRPFDINKEKLLHRLIKERKERIKDGDKHQTPYATIIDRNIFTTPDGFNQSISFTPDTMIEYHLSSCPLL